MGGCEMNLVVLNTLEVQLLEREGVEEARPCYDLGQACKPSDLVLQKGVTPKGWRTCDNPVDLGHIMGLDFERKLRYFLVHLLYVEMKAKRI